MAYATRLIVRSTAGKKLSVDESSSEIFRSCFLKGAVGPKPASVAEWINKGCLGARDLHGAVEGGEFRQNQNGQKATNVGFWRNLFGGGKRNKNPLGRGESVLFMFFVRFQ